MSSKVIKNEMPNNKKTHGVEIIKYNVGFVVMSMSAKEKDNKRSLTVSRMKYIIKRNYRESYVFIWKKEPLNRKTHIILIKRNNKQTTSTIGVT